MKKFVSVLLAIMLAIGAVPVQAFAVSAAETAISPWATGKWFTVSGIEGGQIRFDSNTGAITNCEETVTVANIPPKINGVAVTTIGLNAFDSCSNLTSITIPDSVTEIGMDAFYKCTSLTSVVVGNNVSFIDSGAFSDCSSLTDIIIPDSVTSIMYSAFINCTSLTSVTLPDSMTSIVNGTFMNCTSLTNIKIPGSVAIIAKSAFSNCSSLTSIAIPDSVTVIDETVFQHCAGLTSVTIPASVTAIGADAFDGCSDGLTIYGKSGSYAEKYAKENKIPFVAGKAPDKPSKPTVAGFRDVFEDDYYAKPVQWAVENNVTGGVGEGKFGPNQSCTRAQAVTFLWNAANRPEPQGNGNRFTDVKSGSYYEKAVQWAVENNITGGTDSTHFSPDSTCTRAQIVTFLYHAASSPAVSGSGSFNDVKSGSYYENAVKWAVENGITSGTGNGKFSPYDNCVRAQIVTFLYNYHN